MDQSDLSRAAYAQLVQCRYHACQHQGIVESMMRPSYLDVELLRQVGELDASVYDGSCQGQRVIEHQLLEAIERSACPPQHRHVELLSIVCQDKVRPYKGAKARPYLRHRGSADQILISIAVHVGGLSRDRSAAGDESMKTLYYRATSHAHGGYFDDLACVEVEVAGLNIERDKVVELRLEVAGVE